MDRSLEIVDGALALVEAHKGDFEALEPALRAYVATHRIEVRAMRAKGKEALEAMGEADRAAFVERARAARLKRHARLDGLARLYEQPDEVVALVRLVE